MYNEQWMLRALELAKMGTWATHPNPMVGAVIVRDGELLGEGYHKGAGQKHAEIVALDDATARGHDVRGAQIYVTLEPCNHFGKTPPCTQALIAAGIAQCYIGTGDPDLRVHGKGLACLQSAGIHCELGFLQKELSELNAAYFKRATLGLPYVTCKWAMSLDGRIATKTGSSQWITGPEARIDVHLQRSRHDAILVGTNTIRTDNPSLNVRHLACTRQPLRVVLDRTLRIDPSANVFNTELAPTLLITSSNADLKPYESRGIRCMHVAQDNNKLDLDAILRTLARDFAITTLYCEGGAEIFGSLFDLAIPDACDIYLGAVLIGGKDAKSPVAGQGASLMVQAMHMQCRETRRLGNDVLVRVMRNLSEQ